MIHSKFWVPAAILMGFGLINVYSASMPIALEHYGDPLFFLKRQLVWVVLACLACLAVAQVPLEWWRRIAPVGFFGLLAFLIVMKVAGLGVERNGAVRWIELGGFTLQPSEFAKPLLALYLAKVLSADVFRDGATTGHFMGVLVVGATLMGVIAIQPDFGAAVLLGVILGSLLFVAGAPLPLLGVLGSAAVVIGYEMIMASPYKRGRLLAFMDPWADSQAYGFQLIQSYLALGNGGLFGEGVGLGMQKLFYLPEAHTDFIFSVIGEEWGFVGALLVLMVIGWLLWELFLIARRCDRNRFAQLVTVGIMVALGGAYLFNLSVATGLLPTKGLALPLISYGGSALLAVGISLGLVTRIDREVAA